MKKLGLFLILYLLVIFTSTAQVYVSHILTLHFPDVLRSDGAVSNIQLTGHPMSIGYFLDYYSQMPVLNVDGIAISTGYAHSISGPNHAGWHGTSVHTPGDSLLETMAVSSTLDAAVYEFDILAATDQLSWAYIFGSEEYPWYINNPVAGDIFGIFVSGPNPSGGDYQNFNIATVPGTLDPVNIQTINQNVNSNLYINNDTSSIYHSTFQFNGITVPLEASFSTIPNEYYHVKIAIADHWDSILDSGVLIWSLSQCQYSYSFYSPYGDENESFEALPSYLLLERSDTTVQDTIVAVFTYSGTTNTIQDFSNLPDSVTLYPGENLSVTEVEVTMDWLVEGDEILTINPIKECAAPHYGSTIIVKEGWTLEGGIDQHNFVSCNDSVAAITTSFNAADSVLNFQWSTGETTPEITVLSQSGLASWYFVTVTAVWGQPIVDSVMVKYSPPLLINGFESDTLDCGSDYILPSFQGGAEPLSFIWNNGSTSQDLLNIPYEEQGLYSVTITDYFGCETSADFNLEINPPFSADPESIYDCDDTLMTLFANVSGGTTPYFYIWSNGMQTDSIQDQPSGNYSLIVQDYIGCVLLSPTQYYSVTPFNVSVTKDDIGCTPGFISLHVEGGKPPYQIVWSDSTMVGDSVVITQPGVYHVSIHDVIGCNFDTLINIQMDNTYYVPIGFNSVESPCFETSQYLYPDSSLLGIPLNYQWSNGMTSHTIPIESPGTYSLTISYSLCYWIHDTLISDNLVSLVTKETTTNSSCMNPNGSAKVNLDNENLYTINWSTGDTSFSIDSLYSGLFFYSVNDTCGSAFQDSVFIPYEPILEHEVDIDSILCNGNVVNLTIVNIDSADVLNVVLYDSTGIAITAQSLFSWDTLSPGIYNLDITDVEQCVYHDTITILSPDKFVNIVSSTETTFCDSIEVFLEDKSNATNYNYELQYEFVEIPFQLESTSGQLVTSFSADDRSFGPLDIGFTFEFFDSNYTQFYVGVNGWIGFTDMNESDPYIVTDLPATQNLHGHPVPTNAVFAAWRDWLTYYPGHIRYETRGNAPFRRLVVSFDQIVATSCTVAATFQVVLYENNNSIKINHLEVPVCPLYIWGRYGVMGIQNADGTIAFGPSSMNNTIWTSNNKSFLFYQGLRWYDEYGTTLAYGKNLSTSVSQTTMIYAECETYCGLLIDSILIQKIQILDFSLSPFTVCNDDGQLLHAPPGYNYYWSTGSNAQSLYVDSQGLYSVTITDSYSCSTESEVYINSVVVGDLLEDTIIGCDGDILEIQIDPNIAPIWFDGSSTHNYGVSNPGSYSCTVYEGPCTFYDTVFAEFNPLPFPNFGYWPDGNVMHFINGSHDATSYKWDFGDGSPLDYSENPTHQYPDTVSGSYLVGLTAKNNCAEITYTDWITIFNEVHEMESNNNIYPNPVRRLLNLDLLKTCSLVTFTNMLGSNILTIKPDQRKFKIDCSSLKPGIYICKMEFVDGSSSVAKIVVSM
jgi:hypothetical protein